MFLQKTWQEIEKRCTNCRVLRSITKLLQQLPSSHFANINTVKEFFAAVIIEIKADYENQFNQEVWFDQTGQKLVAVRSYS